MLVWTWAGCAGQGWCGFVGVLLVGLVGLIGLVGVLLVGVDVGWLCWARLLPLAQFREPLNSRFVCLCVRVHICYLHEKAVLYV